MSIDSDFRFPYMGIYDYRLLGLYSDLYLYRFNWVVDFMTDTATDILTDCGDRISERDMVVCQRLSNKEIAKALKYSIMPLDERRWQLACRLHELFKVCRRLKQEDQITVMENFKQARLYYGND